MQLGTQRNGYTLVEVLISLTLSFLVFSVLFTVYYSSASVLTLCKKKNKSQVSAMHSSVRIMDCIRNASAVVDYDIDEGLWVSLRYLDGQIATLAYTNSSGAVNNGGLGLFREGQDVLWFVKNGVTKMMEEEGFCSRPFSFGLTNGTVITSAVLADVNKVYVRYRTSQPADDGGRDLQDSNYAMDARFAVSLRNWASGE